MLGFAGHDPGLCRTLLAQMLEFAAPSSFVLTATPDQMLTPLPGNEDYTRIGDDCLVAGFQTEEGFDH
jgi:hypothetical protein